MKKFFTFIGIVVSILAVAAIVFIIPMAIQGSQLDKESKQYADAVIPAIVSPWNAAELEKRLSPEAKSGIKEEDLQKLFAVFQKLGKMKEYHGAEGSSGIFIMNGNKTISARYIAKVDFGADPAVIELALVKEGDQWEINGFHVNSKALVGIK